MRPRGLFLGLVHHDRPGFCCPLVSPTAWSHAGVPSAMSSHPDSHYNVQKNPVLLSLLKRFSPNCTALLPGDCSSKPCQMPVPADVSAPRWGSFLFSSMCPHRCLLPGQETGQSHPMGCNVEEKCLPLPETGTPSNEMTASCCGPPLAAGPFSSLAPRTGWHSP